MKITEILTESMSPSELRWLDDLADRLFNQLNIDVEFTKHFFDRANDERNDYRDQQGRQHEQGITAEELAKVFVAAYKQASDKNSKFVKVTDIPANSEATIRDHFTKLNIPFVMKKESGQKVLTPKTVMRKDNFANPPGTKAVPVNSKDVALSEATAPKPRNFVAKNAKMGGAGQHVDKKKAEKQGDVKHRKSFMAQEVDEGETWSKHNNKRAGGMSKKSVKSYRRSHPGSKIQTAVTTKPSKIKKGSKDAKRRKSFCARMKGMKKHNTSSKTAHDPNSNINKSLRRWHCESIEQMQELIMIAEQKIRNLKK